MSSSKRILIVGSLASSLIRFRGHLIGQLIANGHTVIAAAPQLDEVTASELRALGAEPRDISVSNSSLNPVSFYSSLRAMRALIRENAPDVILAYTIKPVILSALAGKSEAVGQTVALITGVGYAFTEGREPKRVLSRLLATRLYRMALKKTDVIIFQNKDDQQLFRDLRLVSANRKTFTVNGSGVDLKHFTPTQLPTRPSFLMIARLLKDKGIHEFGAAAKRLKMAYPEVSVILAGDLDPSPNSLNERDLEELIRSGIDFRGYLDDVRDVISECSVFVLPSYREGTPRSVLEAMAMGRAIITTDAPGCRNTVIEGKNGFLAAARDARSLYEAMLRFVQDPALARQMGSASRRLVEERFDVVEVNSELLRVTQLKR